MSEDRAFDEPGLPGNKVQDGGSAAHDDAAMQGRIVRETPVGTTPSHERPSYQDPLTGNTDPTDPGSPEQDLNRPLTAATASPAPS